MFETGNWKPNLFTPCQRMTIPQYRDEGIKRRQRRLVFGCVLLSAIIFVVGASISPTSLSLGQRANQPLVVLRVSPKFATIR